MTEDTIEALASGEPDRLKAARSDDRAITIRLSEWHALQDINREAVERIAELESAMRAAIRHADANGMGAWPVFEKMKKVLER